MADDYKKKKDEKKAEAKQIMTPEQFEECSVAIHSATVVAGAAGAAPIPIADAIPITAAQVSMVIGLGKVFNRKVGETVAKSAIAAAAGTFAGRTLIKFIPVAGWIVSAAVAAGITEAIGWMIAVDMARHVEYPEPDEENKECDEETLDLMNRADEYIYGEKVFSENKEDYEDILYSINLKTMNLPKDHPLKLKEDLLFECSNPDYVPKSRLEYSAAGYNSDGSRITQYPQM